MPRRVLIPAIVLFMSASLLNAHSGGLDLNGGHYNRKTGVYHCHRCPWGCDPTKEQGRTATGERRQAPEDFQGRPAGRIGARVWVNTNSGVYHCPGTRWYGALKSGEFMSEKYARRPESRPAYGKALQLVVPDGARSEGRYQTLTQRLWDRKRGDRVRRL